MHLTYLKISSSNKRRLASVLNSIASLLVLAIALLPLTNASAADLEEIRGLIAAGEIPQARALLLQSPWAGKGHEWELLNLQLAPAGDSLRLIAEELLEFTVSPQQRCAIVGLLAQQFLSTGDPKCGLAVVERWESECRSVPEYWQLVLLRAKLRQAAGEGDKKSIKELKRLLRTSDNADLKMRAAMLLGDIYEQQGRPSEASAYFTRVAQVSERRYRALALSRLRDCYRDCGLTEECDLVTNQLEVHSPGYAADDHFALAAAGNAEDRPSQEARFAASTLTTRNANLYAVRVGSFADQALAQEVDRQFRLQGYTTRLGTDEQSGETLFVVDIGRFASVADAVRFMERLQRQTRDTYFVVSH